MEGWIAPWRGKPVCRQVVSSLTIETPPTPDAAFRLRRRRRTGFTRSFFERIGFRFRTMGRAPAGGAARWSIRPGARGAGRWTSSSTAPGWNFTTQASGPAPGMARNAGRAESSMSPSIPTPTPAAARSSPMN